MNNYDWFYIFNSPDFMATGLVSRTYTVVLDGIGQKDILVTSGEALGMTYDGVFLPLQLNGKNPFAIDERAIYIDENNNVWLGILVDED